MLETLGEGSQVYVLGVLNVREKNGRTFVTMRVAELEKVEPGGTGFVAAMPAPEVRAGA